MGSNVYVGIDLGTTNTFVAYKKKEKIVTLSFMGAGNVIPSVLFLDSETKEIKIGADTYRDGEPIVMTPDDVATEVLKTVRARIIKKLLKMQNLPVSV